MGERITSLAIRAVRTWSKPSDLAHADAPKYRTAHGIAQGRSIIEYGGHRRSEFVAQAFDSLHRLPPWTRVTSSHCHKSDALRRRDRGSASHSEAVICRQKNERFAATTLSTESITKCHADAGTQVVSSFGAKAVSYEGSRVRGKPIAKIATLAGTSITGIERTFGHFLDADLSAAVASMALRASRRMR